MTILLPESQYKRTLLLFLLRSRCTFTQTHCFRLEGELHLMFFSLEQGIYFHDFVWNRVANLHLLSLEQGQVLRHSAAHPHPTVNWGSTTPGSSPGLFRIPTDCDRIILIVPVPNKCCNYFVCAKKIEDRSHQCPGIVQRNIVLW